MIRLSMTRNPDPDLPQNHPARNQRHSLRNQSIRRRRPRRGNRRRRSAPDIGDFSDVEVIEILVAPGDRIEPEQSLLTLESDKASMEIPSPVAGTVQASSRSPSAIASARDRC
jgi:biotin carboxyl carrier protein